MGDQSAISIASTGIVTFNDNIRLPNAATIGPAGDNDAITLNIGTTVFTATTSSTSTTTGAVTVAGGLGLAGDAHFGGDLSLKHDSAVLYFGDGEDVLLTHVADVGYNSQPPRQAGRVPRLRKRTKMRQTPMGGVCGDVKNEAGKYRNC